ncbi:RsmD family RNA methyltransferase [Paenibacillus lautus]|uniref:TRM11 family SAM-dependent methyltransferase n=1 Tax=Paenibacillus lautus TaxID=1401 RepID=UPI002DB651C2|nr:methyltransferase domain-containing protein [Paenibacillus lautus]MEC0204219.1 RsmD family RNA methyltransferase [Paenibacillus lautus]
MMNSNDYDIIFGPSSMCGKSSYLYTYACHETERELCLMELTELFGHVPDGEDWLVSEQWVDPDRSPFLSACIDVRMTGESIERMAEQAGRIHLNHATFKVVCLKAGDRFGYEQSRGYERMVGCQITGTAQMKAPDVTLGMVSTGGMWRLGILHEPERAWLNHKQKPQNYSTGLSSRIVRALVNLAVPRLGGVTLLDPCCGMGNVLIEALSMGITAEGRDINPLAIRGARVNLRHYGYDDNKVAIQDMNTLQGHYDAAILDLPYNLCSVFPEEEKLQMLQSLRRLSDRAVIVSTEPLREQLMSSGWKVLRHCTTRKGSFVREIWLCE